MTVSCALVNSIDNSLLKLEHLTEKLVGRLLSSSKSVSCVQASFTADLNSKVLLVKNLGKNVLKVDNNLVKSNEYYIAREDEVIEFPDRTKFKVMFSSNQSILHCAPVVRIINEMKSLSKTDQSWREIGDGSLLIYSSPNFSSYVSSKVAAFDLDGTLIKTKSGRVFPVDEEDWTLFNPAVANKLVNLVSNGYCVVVFTNQAGIGLGSTNKSKFKEKVESIISSLKIPLQVFISTQYGFFRKPCPGMWFSFLSLNQVDVDMNECLFVGDAAGRPANWAPKKKKDFSSADRLFAKNISIKFLTPEEFFLSESTPCFTEPSFQPSKMLGKTHLNYNISVITQEVIVMVGSPASGKSFFVKNVLIPEGYISISRDELGSWQNCIKIMERELNYGKKLVIDNTNPTPDTRKRYIEVAKKNGVSIRSFVMETSIDCCKHNNRFRQLTDQNHVLVSDVVINEFWKKFTQPSTDEGFQEVITVPFIPEFNDCNEELYNLYLS